MRSEHILHIVFRVTRKTYWSAIPQGHSPICPCLLYGHCLGHSHKVGPAVLLQISGGKASWQALAPGDLVHLLKALVDIWTLRIEGFPQPLASSSHEVFVNGNRKGCTTTLPRVPNLSVNGRWVAQGNRSLSADVNEQNNNPLKGTRPKKHNTTGQ